MKLPRYGVFGNAIGPRSKMDTKEEPIPAPFTAELTQREVA